jgi:uncharacterized SAM-binding protein YcdF (DUF218 family)
MPRPRLRTIVRWAVLCLFLLAAAGAAWLLVYGGRYLLHEDPLTKADAIFVLGGTRIERPLEAVDLYNAGYAPLIVLSPGRPDPGEAVLRQRGIVFPTEAELQRDALIRSGVPAAAVVIPIGAVDNTAEEANLLRSIVLTTHWRRVIVVTSKYHTRRADFAFRRGLAGTETEAVLRASKYDQSDPAHWWRSRPDYREVISEWQKLFAYRLGLSD